MSTDTGLADLHTLLDSRDPFLIGVRHHSAAMARVLPRLLDDFQPDEILVELPTEFAEWLPWLGHAELTAPVALAGCSAAAHDLSFYPFADFSPELAAVRWAMQHDVPIRPCDLPLADHARMPCVENQTDHRDPQAGSLLASITRQTGTDDVGLLWERLVETPSADASPEEVRRSGLLFGYALRHNDRTASEYDRTREAFMRECIAACTGKTAVIVGAYHAAALLTEPLLWSPPSPLLPVDKKKSPPEIATALIPYAFNQLDERSGYPAGIRDPVWHQHVWAAHSPQEIDAASANLIVDVCRALRRRNHPINAADGKEVLRLTRDLATLRGFAAAGRSELLEAIQTCLTRGELMGIGRAVAKALEEVLVGTRAGQLPADVPRSGLAPHVEATLAALNLPGPELLGEEKRVRLDPLRSRLDRARVVTLERLQTCGMPYAERVSSEEIGNRQHLTDVWQIQWQHATAAMIELSSARGATLAQATMGVLRSQGLQEQTDDWTAAQLPLLLQAAHCGLGGIVTQGLRWLTGPFAMTASLSQLTLALEFLQRLQAGHIPALPTDATHDWPQIVQSFRPPADVQTTPLLQAAIARLDGLAGSQDPADVSGILDLVLWFQQQPADGPVLAAGRMVWTFQELATSAGPLIQGAATSALLLLDVVDAETFGTTLSSWMQAAVTAESRTDLQGRLRGAVFVALPRLTAELNCLDASEQTLNSFSDAEFLERLPALRSGFHVLSPAARDRLLQALLERLGNEVSQQSAAWHDDPETAAARFAADEAGRAAVLELMPDWQFTLPGNADAITERTTVLARTDNQLSPADRWRLVLGAQKPPQSAMGRAAARALDELYGTGKGEGANGRSPGPGGGKESSYPGVREWSEELGELFGDRVREEVLGEALAEGRSAVLGVLDGETVTPSIELLEQLLSLKGAVPEAQLSTLRRLASRVTAELVKELAVRLRPALNGLSTPRPTTRPTRRLDLHRTIRANLKTARRDEVGKLQLLPERLIFRSRSQRAMDWHLIFVVDVSGSMEPSVIYSAMLAAIFSGLPAISVQFLAFSTEVIDLSERVDDPLALLMEVQVGGGTHIAKGLRAARERLRLPSRSLVVTVSDFEEGWPVSGLLGEVRQLVDSGVKTLGLAALSDDGQPRYNKGIARQIVSCGMPVAALSPLELARWVGEQIR